MIGDVHKPAGDDKSICTNFKGHDGFPDHTSQGKQRGKNGDKNEVSEHKPQRADRGKMEERTALHSLTDKLSAARWVTFWDRDAD